ncbi:hypothetical protein [Synechococcus sp. 1G10]|uniref:hypothetical protein n=1 Tax=Synechococcus sp. 1G10 TaxID=2025605 RepID=UPI00117D88D2|nr:hypothetical protein [Synechococcus sp. 1G10]
MISYEEMDILGATQKGSLILFNRLSCSFQPLNAFHNQLRADLLSITRRRSLQTVWSYPEPIIGMHLRFGDFKPPPREGAGAKWVGWLQQTPIEWFVETLQVLRREATEKIPVVISSDGNTKQLAPLLELGNVRVLPPTNALVDLLTLGRCRLLLGTGSSTFSAWASFLGQQTAVTAPGKSLANWGLQPQRNQLIDIFNPREPDGRMIDAMLNALDRASSLTLAPQQTGKNN